CVNTPLSSCCGNGVVEAGEECDDGNTSNTDACLTTCVAARCGDGFVETGVEDCDLGAQNSDAPNAACRTDCHPQRCGDGIVDDQHGEQCDDGNTIAGDGCSPTCQVELPATAQRIPGKGSATTDCALEWAMDRPAVDGKGVPSIKQKCQDGAACDSGSTAGECTFSVWICANNTDPHLPTCHPGAGANGIGTVVQASVSKPSTNDAAVRPEDAANRQALLQGTAAAQSATANFCGPRLQIRVPLKAPGRKGVKTLSIRGTTDRSVGDPATWRRFGPPWGPGARGSALARGLEVGRDGRLADPVPVTEGAAVPRLQLEGRAYPRLRAEEAQAVAPAADETLRVLVKCGLRKAHRQCVTLHVVGGKFAHRLAGTTDARPPQPAAP